MKRQKSQKRYRESGELPSRVAELEPPANQAQQAGVTPGAVTTVKPRPRATAPRPTTRTARKRMRLTRTQRYRKAAALLREWMADDSGYDEQVGALLEEELRKDPIRLREEF